MKHKRVSRGTRVVSAVLMDIALIGAGLCVFALFHHVIPREEISLGIKSVRGAAIFTAAPSEAPTVVPTDAPTAAPTIEAVAMAAPVDVKTTPTPTPTPTPVPTPTPDPVGYFGTKFADKFIEGEPQVYTDEDGTSHYISENINMTATVVDTGKTTCYVTDFYIRDITCLRTALANDTYGKGNRDSTSKIANAHNAVAAINGDYYSARDEGVVIRNGELYRRKAFGDLGVIYWDGTMETYPVRQTDVDAIMARGAYQAWSFGPRLLDDDGQPRTKFDSMVTTPNPRTAIGYYEPGHYCFVNVDGRSKESNGMTMRELSNLMYTLGCVRAYNLDGGQTAELIWMGKVANKPAGGGRKCSDIVYIVDAM